MKRFTENVIELVRTNISLGYMLTDDAGNIVEFNPAAEKITGFTREQVAGGPVKNLFGSFLEEDGSYHKSLDRQPFNDISESEMIITTRDGERKNIAITSFPVRTVSGSYTGSGHFFRDISRRVQMENERKNLLAMFAHDIKNPASGSALLVDRMLAGKVGELSEKQREYLRNIQGSLGKIIEFTDSFVVYSRLGGRHLVLNRGTCNLAAALQHALDDMKELVYQKNIDIEVRNHLHDSTTLYGDSGMIDRVLANIIGNSVKYVGENGRIKVKLSCWQGRIRCTVADNGIGIPAKALGKVFTPFYRVPGTNCPGSGLGLAIVKTIIEAHGGTIAVKSAPGKGTVVSFTLPLTEDSW